MKLSLISLILTMLISTSVRAEKFDLQNSNDKYVSLNECLYALSNGTQLSTGKGDAYIYKNSVWEFSFTGEQQFECKSIGELVD